MNVSDLPDRIASKIRISGDCWLWTGAHTGPGYGNVHFDGRMRGAHRVVWTLLVGEIPEGHFLDHDGPTGCHVRDCVYPGHLCVASPRENVYTATGGRGATAGGERCMRGHDLTTPGAVKHRSSGYAGCRQCENDAQAIRNRSKVNGGHK